MSVKKRKSSVKKKISKRTVKKKVSKKVVKKVKKVSKKKKIERRYDRFGNLVYFDEKRKLTRNYIEIGIPGFNALFTNGIPQGSNVLVSGGAGSGKTILCLQTLINQSKRGKKCLYLSFEESDTRLIEHMENFGWDPKKLIKKGNLKIQRCSPFDISRDVEALLEREKGELLINVEPITLPKSFKPDFIVVDSLTAVASAFIGKEDSYRIYIEQLFRYFEKSGSTSFLIAETEQVPKIYSATGVEEFLADGVIVLYNLKKGDIRENAIEILKMRGEKHLKKITAMRITNEGIVVYPSQEIFTELD